MPTFMGTSGERGKQSSHYLALLPAGTMFILTLQPKKLIQRGLGSLLKAMLQGSTGPRPPPGGPSVWSLNPWTSCPALGPVPGPWWGPAQGTLLCNFLVE